MRKFFYLVAVIALGAISWSCSDDYDDSAIWTEINNLKTQIEKLNSDLTKVQTAVSKLESGKYIVEYTETETSCTLKFNDGTSLTIENGKDGAPGSAGKDAPIIGIKESNGIYYWTLTTNGEETWLTIPGTTDRIPVNGKDGATPEMGVDAEGYWTVNGTRISDAAGNPVKAAAEASVSIFSGSEVSDDGTMVILTLANGGSIEIPLRGKLNIAISETSADFGYGETKAFNLTLTGVEKTTFTKPDGWKVAIEGTKLTVTAPAKENTYAEAEGTVAVIGMTGNYSCMAELNVAVGEPSVTYQIDGGAWTNAEPAASFSTLVVKTSFGGMISETQLQTWEDLIPDGSTYSLDLGAADYESNRFKSYYNFGFNEKLQAIVLPRNITELPDAAFMNCTALESCIMPDGLKKVGNESVFSGAVSLKRIEFPEGVTSLGKMMFYYCPMMSYGPEGVQPALEEVVIPSTVTEWTIGAATWGSYWFFGCSNLKKIVCKVVEAPDMGDPMEGWGDFDGGAGMFEGVEAVPDDCIIYVPDESINDYKQQAGWNRYSIKGLSELQK